jgi:hypothetical protein
VARHEQQAAGRERDGPAGREKPAGADVPQARGPDVREAPAAQRQAVQGGGAGACPPASLDLRHPAAGRETGGWAHAGARGCARRAGERAASSRGDRWRRDAWTPGPRPRRGAGAGRRAAAPVRRGGRGLAGRTAPGGVLPGPQLPGSVRLCHCGGGPPAWVDAVGSCALSLRELTRGLWKQEDSIDGLWKGERSHYCRVSGLLEHTP